jgi:hypothetical protein
MRPLVHAKHPGHPERSLCGHAGPIEGYMDPVTCWECAVIRTQRRTDCYCPTCVARRENEATP